MARICSMVGAVLLVVSGVVQAAVLSPDANFIKTREYLQFSTGNSIGPLAPDPNEPDVWKANGTLPSIGHGLPGGRVRDAALDEASGRQGPLDLDGVVSRDHDLRVEPAAARAMVALE